MATIHRITHGKTRIFAGPGAFIPAKGCYEVLEAYVTAMAVIKSYGNPTGKDYQVTVYTGSNPIKRHFYRAANFYTLNEAIAAARDWVK